MLKKKMFGEEKKLNLGAMRSLMSIPRRGSSAMDAEEVVGRNKKLKIKCKSENRIWDAQRGGSKDWEMEYFRPTHGHIR